MDTRSKQKYLYERFELMKTMVEAGDFGTNNDIDRESLEEAIEEYVLFDLPVKEETKETLKFPRT